jgi:hypothetical protein
MAWGTNTWGTGNWGDNPLDVNVSVTGFQLTSVLGTASAQITVDVFVTGQLLTSNVGSPAITADANVSLTGFSLSANLGNCYYYSRCQCHSNWSITNFCTRCC